MQIKDIAILIADTANFFLVCVAFFCLYHYKNNESKTLKNLYHYIFLCAVISILADILNIYQQNNLSLLHLLTLGEFVLLSLFYREMITKPNLKTKGFLIFIAFISILIISNSIFLQDIFTYNTYAKSLVQVIIITYSIIYFYNLTVNLDEEPHLHSSHTINDISSINSQKQKSIRLINSSILLYYSGSLFIFMFGNQYKQNEDIFLMFWAFNAGLLLLVYILIAIGIWKTIYQAQKFST
jgi:hypothetical protein